MTDPDYFGATPIGRFYVDVLGLPACHAWSEPRVDDSPYNLAGEDS